MLGKGLESLIPKKPAGAASGTGSFRAPSSSAPKDDKDFSIDDVLPRQNVSPTGPVILSVHNFDSVPPEDEPEAGADEAASTGPSGIHAQQVVASEESSSSRASFDAIYHIPVSRIKPNPQQPRRVFDEQGIKELAASIREFGILQPLVVVKAKGDPAADYYLIAGERRLRASQSLGLESVPAIVRDDEGDRENLELAIIENLQRENLSAIEMARAFARLQDEFRLTQREIATRMGKSREAVANTMRLLDLPISIQVAIENGTISESHGRLLLAVTDPGAQLKLFHDLVNKHLTTRELKTKVGSHAGKKPGRPRKGDSDELLTPEMRELQERMSSDLGTPVKISVDGDGGKMTISFYSKEELSSIVRRLGLSEE